MSNLSLCSGAGTLDLAVEQITGNETLVYSENYPPAARVMEAHFPWAVNLGDLKAIDWTAVAAAHPHIDTITAGFPCQGLSNAGLRKGLLDARSALWKNVAEAVRILRPRLVFLENVAAIRARGLGEVVADLAAIGYSIRWTCFRAGDPEVGAPHPRDRWFAVAYPAAEDPDSAAWRERWAAASAEAESRRARTDAGGRGGIPAPRAAGDGAEDGLVLLPSPVVADVRGTRNYTANRRPGAIFNKGKTLTDFAWLLSDEAWISVEGVDYGPAIRRWERILGRPAPFPTEPGARGNRRLTPLFVEWMQGCDEGWVTGLDLGRKAELTILGNLAMTRQAVEGYRRLLCADLEAMAA